MTQTIYNIDKLIGELDNKTTATGAIKKMAKYSLLGGVKVYKHTQLGLRTLDKHMAEPQPIREYLHHFNNRVIDKNTLYLLELEDELQQAETAKDDEQVISRIKRRITAAERLVNSYTGDNTDLDKTYKEETNV
jgi:hypothetical protein